MLQSRLFAEGNTNTTRRVSPGIRERGRKEGGEKGEKEEGR